MSSTQQFAITITASPQHSDQASRALRFAQTIHASHYQLRQIFFYGDGVFCAQPNSISARAWETVAKQTHCALYVCVSAAERRGVKSLDPPWQLVGLGDWISGMQLEHHLHFGDAND